jgi:hypothetical protein
MADDGDEQGDVGFEGVEARGALGQRPGEGGCSHGIFCLTGWRGVHAKVGGANRIAGCPIECGEIAAGGGQAGLEAFHCTEPAVDAGLAMRSGLRL